MRRQPSPDGTMFSGAVSSLNWYAYVGTPRVAVQRSTCRAGHAKLASETRKLNATAGAAPGGYTAAIAAARAADTPRAWAMLAW